MQRINVDSPQVISRLGWAVLGAVSLLLLGIGVALAAWRLASSKQPPLDYALEHLPVIRTPRAVPAAAAKMLDDALVIGVEAGGRRRAYLLEAFYPWKRHVINDLLGGKPITVTYCDIIDCQAVFTDSDATEPLEIASGGWQGRVVRGWVEGSMHLRVGSPWYRQDTGQPLANHADKPFPYAKAWFVRTTWKHWRDAHPDTDAYVGENSSDHAG